MGLNHEKTGGRKSRDTLPLRNHYYSLLRNHYYSLLRNHYYSPLRNHYYRLLRSSLLVIIESFLPSFGSLQ